MKLLDNTGHMSFETFNLFDRKQYNNIIKSIPQSIIQISCNFSQNNLTPCLPQLLVNGVSLTKLNFLNIVIRKVFVMELYSFSSN